MLLNMFAQVKIIVKYAKYKPAGIMAGLYLISFIMSGCP